MRPRVRTSRSPCWYRPGSTECERTASDRAGRRGAPCRRASVLRSICSSAGAEATEWLGADLHRDYLKFKRAELAGLEGLDEDEICRRYAAAY